MDRLTRMKYIRVIDKMNQNPVLSRKLGLKDTSYIKKDEQSLQKGERNYG